MEFKLIETEKFAEHEHDVNALRRNAVGVGERGSTKFALDISRHEYCGDKQRFQVGDVAVYGYSPEMSSAEKLRAICQQMPEYRQMVRKHLAGRARDFIDIHDVAESYLINFASGNFHETMRRVFAAKRVPMSLIGKIDEYRDDHRADFASVQATVKPGVQLQEFDYYVDYVVSRCRDLEALWNV